MNNVAYKINLNKATNRLDHFEQKQKQKRFFAIGFYFVVILAIAALAMYKSFQTQKVIDNYKAELTQIEEEINRLEISSAFLSPEDIFALSELATTRLTWTEKLNVLGNILPKNVCLTELSYDYQIRTLQIKGISKVNPNTKDLDLVVSIINLIKENKNFSTDFVDIKFSSSNRIKQQGQEIVQFEIACIVG